MQSSGDLHIFPEDEEVEELLVGGAILHTGHPPPVNVTSSHLRLEGAGEEDEFDLDIVYVPPRKRGRVQAPIGAATSSIRNSSCVLEAPIKPMSETGGSQNLDVDQSAVFPDDTDIPQDAIEFAMWKERMAKRCGGLRAATP